MNELKGKFVNIVLSIEEGRGFDSVRMPIYITANFNGRVMESDVMDPHPNILFNTEMVWETEKKLLRKARGAYGRIRLECFTSEKKFIGFALLCLRSAKILPSSRTNLEVSYQWNKLLNVPSEYKKGTPELNLALTIKDFITNKMLPPAIPNFADVQDNTHVKIPIKYTLNGYIKVGEDCANLEKFYLKITAKIACNLDTLLPEDMVFSKTPKNNFLSFNIFGMDVNTRIIRDLHENINVNETVVINLLSNIEILGLYFQEYTNVVVTLFCGEVKLGWTNIDMKFINFDESDGDKRFDNEQECYFMNDETNYEGCNRRPSLTTHCIIEMGSNKEEGQGDKDIVVSPRIRFSSIKDVVDVKTTHVERQLVQKDLDENVVKLMQTTETSSDDAKGEPLIQYKQFCLDIILDSIVWKTPPRTSSYILNFLHPKANTYLHIKTEIDRQVNKKLLLENAVCKMMFVCSRDRITQMLNYYSPRMQMFDQKSSPIAKEVTLDCTKINLLQPECSFLIKLRGLNDQDLADVNVCMFLESCNLKTKSGCGFDLLPHILDDCILFDDLDELERWKEGERKRFEEELQRLKQEELEKLHDDWVSRKNKLENDLKNNIERCKKLSRELKKNTHSLMLDKEIEDRAEGDSEFNLFLEIHKNTVKYSLCESHELIEKICYLEHECTILKDILNEQSMEMQEIKQSALTSEQTKNLLHDLKTLEEKLEDALRDKNYFKAEWEKTMKEVHSLKVEDQKNIQNKIACEKEQLSQLSLDTFVNVV